MPKPKPPESRLVARAQQALATVRCLAGLPLYVQTAVAQAAVPRHYDSGQIIYLEGEPAQALFTLERGWGRATRTSPEGREQAMLFLRAGEIFGYIAVFTGTPYPGTVMAIEPANVWASERTDILDLVARHQELALAVIRHLSERVLYTVGLVEDLSLRSVEARLAHAGRTRPAQG